MPVYDMSCPKCGRQATEYEADKWRCLDCGNRFVYKMEPPAAVNSTTNVNIAAPPLFDLEIDGAANTRPLLVPWLTLHKAEDDEEMARDLRTFNKVGCFAAVFGAGLFAVAALSNHWDIAPIFLLITVAAAFFSISHTPAASARIQARLEYLRTVHVRGGTVVLCPYCHEKVAEFRAGDAGPHDLRHCIACGKQFFLTGSNSYRIKAK